MDLSDQPNTAATSEELFALADAIAAVINGSVAIEGLDRRVLAYSSLPDQHIDELRRRGILERRVPDQAEQDRQYQQVLSAPGVMHLPVLASDELPRAAVAIRVGDQPLGTIWAIEGGEPLDRDGELALLDGARLAALHILRQRNPAERDARAREEALRGALTGDPTAFRDGSPLRPADRPQLTLTGFVLARMPGHAPPPDVPFAEAAARHWAAVHPQASTAALFRTVYALVPGDPAATVRRLAGHAATALSRTLGVEVRAALSRTTEDPADLPALRAEVDDILRVSAARPAAQPVTDVDHVRTRVVLVRLADELARHPHLHHPGVRAVVDYDRAHDTSYAASVMAWLDAMGNVGEAARHLTIHPNTLKYRLRRTRELFDIDLDNPDDRLSCWLQLRLHDHPLADG